MLDLAYVRAHPDRLPIFLHHQRVRETPVGGGSICEARRLTLEDGASLFAKSVAQTRPGFFEAEAAGLRWLGEATGQGGAAVPEVVVALPELLALAWIEPGQPTPAAAQRFGQELAATHRAGAASFGAPWRGYIGSLDQDNTPDAGGWAAWFAARRLTPYLHLATDRGALSRTDAAAVHTLIDEIDRYAPPPEPPSRLHGDLWPGNLVWGEDRVWLVDPAAHGGHRETDLAQLALFGGAPYLDRILAGYAQVWPLADGWRERVALHQLPLLLVHAALFGTAYRDRVMAAVASVRDGG